VDKNIAFDKTLYLIEEIWGSSVCMSIIFFTRCCVGVVVEKSAIVKGVRGPSLVAGDADISDLPRLKRHI
jgi:hypothetical protein